MAGSVYEISGAESIIGRASGCAVPIQDDTFVSHLHARIFTRGAEFWIEDLGSTNGSFVNGKKLVSPVPLRDADKVQIGRTTFEVSR
jgi:pSer/pThr/pTyr-binding forkhead associated (FHA) protein